MEDTEYFLVIITIAFAILYFLTPGQQNFPPGPKPWPLVGNFFQLKNPRHITFMNWAKTYGDIIGLHFGSLRYVGNYGDIDKFRIVVLNHHELIREAFSEQVFTGRPKGNFFNEWRLGGNRGIVFSDGVVWTEQRHFALKNLKKFGFGKTSMEESIMIDVRELISSFKKEINQPFVSHNRFNVAVLNALWSILTSERHSHDDPVTNEITNTLTKTIAATRGTASDIFPLLHYFKNKLSILLRSHLTNFLTKSYFLIGEVIKRHEETLQIDSPRDFIDAYLIEMRNKTNASYIFKDNEGDKQLRVAMLDMFAGGSETTSTTLTYSCLLLASHPDVQENLFQEIQRVVGSSREVSLSDRSKLPYLEATIMEVQRYASVFPMIIRTALQDVQFHGYKIKKGTWVIGNLFAALHSKRAWGDPEKFRPERFLSDDRQNIARHKAFIPFGFGKRVCIGESLAKQEMFLFMGNIFKTFQVNIVEGGSSAQNESYSPLVVAPRPHELVLIKRKPM